MSMSLQQVGGTVGTSGRYCQLLCLAGLACTPVWTRAEAPFPVQASVPLRSTAVHQSELRASADFKPDAPRPLVPLSAEQHGDICVARKMYRDGIDFYRLAPPSAGIYNKIGIAFEQLLRFDLAKENYETALKIDPHHAHALNNLGTVYYGQRSYRKAITYYRRSLQASRPNASVYVNLASAYFAHHNYKAASDYMGRALDLDPDVLDRHDMSGTQIREQTATDLAAFHLYLAETYAKRGVNERALLYLRKALEEGIKDRKKIPQLPEFNSLKKDPAFWQLLAENPTPL